MTPTARCSMCASFRKATLEDRVYLLVQRANGVFLERMRSTFWTFLPNDPDVDLLTEAAFVDLDAVPTTAATRSACTP